MRIIAGRHRGLKLAEPGKGDPAAHLRPTADRVREALFSMLTAGRLGDRVRDAVVLDLFAGTGALGLEALSRGAKAAVFVERGRVALGLLRDNLSRAREAAEVIVADATRLPARRGAAADLVFLDPPYGQGLGAAALESALAGGWIAPGAVVVWEEGAEVAVPEGFTLVERRRYGAAVVTVLLHEGGG